MSVDGFFHCLQDQPKHKIISNCLLHCFLIFKKNLDNKNYLILDMFPITLHFLLVVGCVSFPMRSRISPYGVVLSPFFGNYAIYKKKETIMSNKENNQKSNNEVKYYSSTHAESGFLTSLSLIESDYGSDYYAIKFKASRGNSKKPSFAPHSVRVNGSQAKEVIAQVINKVDAQLKANKKLWDAKKGKEALGILISLNVSDTIAKCYMNKHTGKDVSYIDGRCTSIAYVRIGKEVIFQKTTEKNITDQVVLEGELLVEPTKSLTQDQDLAPHAFEREVSAEIDTSTGELAQEVKLDPTSADFMTRKEELKSLGYTWDANKKAWTLK
jgi:hypothetical protein